MLISYCKNWVMVGKNLDIVHRGYRAALTFFPQGYYYTLKEISTLPSEDFGKVPFWFTIKNLNEQSAKNLLNPKQRSHT